MQEWMILLSINVFLAFYVVLLYFRWRRNVGKHMLKTEEDKLQIIQLEKMASLGTLSAGVAHEINNPLTYIITNLNLIGGYAAQIKEVKDVDDQIWDIMQRMEITSTSDPNYAILEAKLDALKKEQK